MGRKQLGDHVRELLLCGHLIDRATMPHVIGTWDREIMRDIAIDEWMGASPIYTKRMQRLLGFEGDDVETIFKGMQFDIGAPPQFMDFRYTVHDAHHGEFHLDHCGALMDVEPMGPDYVFTMCHDIEDPTFDATAWATNAQARMRPIHRPPRDPHDRHPHCAWTVTIDRDAPALPEPQMATIIATTNAAQLAVPTIEPGDGAVDYAGPLVNDIDFTTFTPAALLALTGEVALQGHLLALASMATIAGRFGVDAAKEVGRHQLVGSAGITAQRLRIAHGLGSTLGDIASLLALHPLFFPSTYVDAQVYVDGDEVCLDLRDCPALHEANGLSWPALLVAGDATPIEVIAQAVNPCARSTPRKPTGDAVASFAISIEATPQPIHPDVELAAFSTGADFAFTPESTRVSLRARRDRPASPPSPVV